MEPNWKVIEAVSEIGRMRVLSGTVERQLAAIGQGWLEQLQQRRQAIATDEDGEELAIELAGVVESLRSVAGSPQVNLLLGRSLTLLLELKRSLGRGRMIMRQLLGMSRDIQIERDRKRVLTFNPAPGVTQVALFEGLELVREAELDLSPDEQDTPETRAATILAWLTEQGLGGTAGAGLAGLACRGGFLRPIPSGTYRLVSAMLQDLEQASVEHPVNLAVRTAFLLAQQLGAPDGLLLTTSDPVVCDEMELPFRMTGHGKVRRDGTALHYLNHKAVWRLLAGLLGRGPTELDAITGHLSGGLSFALHRQGRVVDGLDAFALPSPSRAGTIEMTRLLAALQSNELNLKALEAAAYGRGGLLSLADTNDFTALATFRHHGANEDQRRKIGLIFDFFARSTAAAILQLTADGRLPHVVALTGGLAHVEELVRGIEADLNGRYPLVLVPGSLTHQALAAGLLRGLYEPDTLLDYEQQRDQLRTRRLAEDRLLATTIFERRVSYRRENAPIFSLDELIDATCQTVRKQFLPTVGIVGADNEEAILASKMANEEGTYRIAKFRLLGDFQAISQIAYDYDLVIDNDNYTIVDTEDPVEEATRLFDAGQLHVLMKGSMKTEVILRGVFKYLKASGRLKPDELISHVVVVDIPRRKKLVLITDAAVNTYPDEEKRVKIINNALKVATNLKIRQPKVAIISAIESVNKSVESSMEAQRIAERFAGRTDCVVEGPLSFDVAMDAAIAHEKKYKGQIKGSADILLMPDIDAGNVAYKSLTTQSGATVAGVILCGDMPMVLTSRGDSARSKLASISLAVNLYFQFVKQD